MGAWNVRSENLDDTLDTLVVALCYGFFARDKAIKEKRCTRRTLMEYEYINQHLESAVREIVGDDYEIYISEIGNRIGYAKSELYDVGETKYKKLKKEVKINVAKRLHLVD